MSSATGVSNAVRWAPPALAVALVTGTGIAAVAADHPRLTRDRGLAVLVPRDGARVDDGFLLAWTAGAHKSLEFAVIVDATPPAPREAVVPGPATMLVRGTALRLTLGPRHGGSPSTRGWHEISIVPVDANGYRVGEDVTVVHLRDAGS